MGEDLVSVGYSDDSDDRGYSDRYYRPLDNGFYSHPETDGDFEYSNPADNR